MAVGRFFFSAAPTAQNSPKLHFHFINSFIHQSCVGSLRRSDKIHIIATLILESRINAAPEINIASETFVKNSKCSPLNTRSPPQILR